jgi:hypothetical protein
MRRMRSRARPPGRQHVPQVWALEHVVGAGDA